MKYQQLVSMPSAVSDWLEEQLEVRGIDALVYTRYVLSLLHNTTVDVVHSDEDLQFSVLNKKVDRANSVRKQPVHHESDWWKYADIDAEQLKRSDAIQCLLSGSDQNCGIESLIDELCEKLKQVDSEQEPCTSSQLLSDLDRSVVHEPVSPQELAERYYAAFPPLRHNSHSPPGIEFPMWIYQKDDKELCSPLGYEDELRGKADSSNMKARSSARRLNFHCRNRKKDLLLSHNMARSLELADIEDILEDRYVKAKSLDTFDDFEESEGFGRLSPIGRKAPVQKKQRSINLDFSHKADEDEDIEFDIFDVPVNLIDLLDSPVKPRKSPVSLVHSSSVEAMNLANKKNTVGAMKFIPYGISSIWSNNTDDDSSSDDCGNSKHSDLLLDLQLGSISIDKTSDNDRRSQGSVTTDWISEVDRHSHGVVSIEKTSDTDCHSRGSSSIDRAIDIDRHSQGSASIDKASDVECYFQEPVLPEKAGEVAFLSNDSASVVKTSDIDCEPQHVESDADEEEHRLLSDDNSNMGDVWTAVWTDILMTQCFDPVRLESLHKSLLNINHDGDRGAFSIVMPRPDEVIADQLKQYAKNLADVITSNPSVITSASIVTAASAEIVRDSAELKFQPIPALERKARGLYPDGATFPINDELAKVDYKRTQTGTMFLETEYGACKRYYEYRKRDPKREGGHEGYKGPRLGCADESSSSDSYMASPDLRDFVLKFNVRQNDKACQTMDGGEDGRCESGASSDDYESFIVLRCPQSPIWGVPRYGSAAMGGLLMECKCTCGTTGATCHLHPGPQDHAMPEIRWKYEGRHGDRCCGAAKPTWDWSWWRSMQQVHAEWPDDLRNIWGEAEICQGCRLNSKLFEAPRPPSEHHSQLREDISQDGEQLLLDLSSLQRVCMEEGPQASAFAMHAPEIASLFASNERKRRHSFMAAGSGGGAARTHNRDPRVVTGPWECATRFETDYLTQMAQIPTLRAVTL